MFESLFLPGFKHGIFTRRGGVSSSPWTSLNVGSSVGDDPQHVEENLRRSFAALALSRDSLFDVAQVHGNAVVEAMTPRGSRPPSQADVILTRQRGVPLLMRFADCVPILLLDPVTECIGIAHAGWQGTVKNVAGAAVKKMVEWYGSKPTDIRAGIGPSICKEHYAVGSKVMDAARHQFGDTLEEHIVRHRGREHFDLWSANRALLEDAGVRSIEIAGLCTACQQDDWYSHRASGGRTGRFSALICLAG